MAEINLGGAFSFLDSFKKILAVSLIILLGFSIYTFRDQLAQLVSESTTLEIIEQTAQLSDDDILSSGYWVLNKDRQYWECRLSVSIHNHDFCAQTGEFYNDAFVKQFQLRLEAMDTIVVEVMPDDDPNSTFQRYWIGVYKTVFGPDRDLWGEPLFVIYFQVGATDDTRRVIYTLDKNDAKEGRVVTTFYEDIILNTVK